MAQRKTGKLKLLTISAILMSAAYFLHGEMGKSSLDLRNSSVRIYNIAGNSGGSGVIIENNDVESKILTNSHVCGLVVNGGIVKTNHGELFLVDYFQRSKEHDLCLITIRQNLGSSLKLAPRPTDLYDQISSSGHPALLSHILSPGHVSDRGIITILAGIEKCSEEEKTNDLMCALYGIKPVLKRYEAVLITSVVMPGSSGSAVVNSKGDIIGLVFAGMGEGPSYGFIVPYEYLHAFLNYELLQTEKEVPSNSVQIMQDSATMKDICKRPDLHPALKNLCKSIVSDLIWTE